MAVALHSWHEIAGDDMAKTFGRKIWVEDGTVGHYTSLRDGETVAEALASYAYGYEGNRGDHIKVRWELWQNGVELDAGDFTFIVR